MASSTRVRVRPNVRFIPQTEHLDSFIGIPRRRSDRCHASIDLFHERVGTKPTRPFPRFNSLKVVQDKIATTDHFILLQATKTCRRVLEVSLFHKRRGSGHGSKGLLMHDVSHSILAQLHRVLSFGFAAQAVRRDGSLHATGRGSEQSVICQFPTALALISGDCITLDQACERDRGWLHGLGDMNHKSCWSNIDEIFLS